MYTYFLKIYKSIFCFNFRYFFEKMKYVSKEWLTKEVGGGRELKWPEARLYSHGLGRGALDRLEYSLCFMIGSKSALSCFCKGNIRLMMSVIIKRFYQIVIQLS